MPDPTPSTVLTGLDLETSISQLETALFAKLEKSLGTALTDIARIYLPALRRMGLSDLMSFMDLSMNAKNYEQARKVAHDAMSPEELTAEKEKLSAVITMMADSNAQRVLLAKQAYGAGLVLAIRTLIGLAAGGL